MMDIENSNLVTISNADHSKYVTFALRNLFESKRGTDFEFRFWGKSVKVHRLIVELFLTSKSIGSDQIEASANAIKQDVPDEDCGGGRSILDFVVEFLYTGEVTVPEQQLEELLGVAEALDFQMLVEAVRVCRPIDIIADVEPNIDMKGTPYCSETVSAVEEFLEPRIEVFDDKESLHLNELSLSPSLANLRPRISASDQSTSADMTGSGHLLHDVKSQGYEISNFELLQPIHIKLEPEDILVGSNSRFEDDSAESLDLELANSDEEDDGGTSPDSPPQGTSSDPPDRSPVKKPPRTRKCPNCEFETSNSYSYRSHCLTLHKLTMRGEPAPVHRCTKCDYSSIYFCTFKKHLATKHTEEMSHACLLCSYTGKLKSQLKEHLVRVHGKADSIFICEVCEIHCESQYRLKRHVLTHTTERPFKCPHCNYGAKSKDILKRHCSVIHGEGEWRYTCSTCKKRCDSSASLERHLRTHTNSRPFKCTLCSHAAKQLYDLKKHMGAMHGE